MSGPDHTDATTAFPRKAGGPPDPTGELVSVITRTRNRPELLVEAVASVAAQTHPHRELIVVNDGGSDVGGLLDGFRDRLRIKHLTPGRVGRCRAANLGIEAASGTWVAFLDDDDLHYPAHLQTALRRLKESGSKIVYTDAHRIDQERSSPHEPWREIGRSVPYSEEFSRIMLLRRGYIHLVTVVIHRECFERLGGFDESLEVLEDLDLFFRFAQDYDFLHVKEITAAFRIRNDLSNAVTQLRSEFVETRTKLFHKYLHVVFPEMLGILDHGQALLADLAARVARLEAERKPGHVAPR